MTSTRKWTISFSAFVLFTALSVFINTARAAESEFDVAKSRAEHGVPAYQFMLAQMYETGYVTEIDMAEAVRWYAGLCAAGGV